MIVFMVAAAYRVALRGSKQMLNEKNINRGLRMTRIMEKK